MTLRRRSGFCRMSSRSAILGDDFLVVGAEFFLLQAGELLQAHFEDGASLRWRELVAYGGVALEAVVLFQALRAAGVDGAEGLQHGQYRARRPGSIEQAGAGRRRPRRRS